METDLSKIALAEAMELGPEPARFRHWWERIAVKWYFGPVLAVLLLVHTGLLGWSAVQHSPNANEPSHLAAGIHDWQSGRFVLFRGNPPLVRMVAAVPVLAVGAETDWSHYSESSRSRPEFQVGRDFIAANGERSLWLSTLARLACIPFSLIGAVVCFLWARALYGLAAGFVSLTLWSALSGIRL
jgi:hypothetical protein